VLNYLDKPPVSLQTPASAGVNPISVNSLKNPQKNEIPVRDELENKVNLPNLSKSIDHSFWDKAKIWAKIFDSRASTYRAVMDLIGADIPTVIGGMRNIYSFIESVVEASASFVMVFAAPKITSIVSQILGKFMLDKKEHADISNHLLFHRQELHDDNSYKSAIERVLEEELHDKKHIANLYRELGRDKQARKQDQELEKIDKFYKNFKTRFDHEDISTHRKKILRFKEAVQLAESFVEGGIWGSFGITMRLFRKYILKQNSFTGTQGYTTEAERKKLGDDSKIGFKEYLGAIVGMGISPLLNYLVLNATRNRSKLKDNKFLQFLDHQFDMTHGLYPRLGMMFSFMVIPKWSSVFLTAQGRNELIEKFSKAISMIPLWWLGQKITNGPLAAKRDQELHKKHGTKPGILVNRPDPKEPGFIGFLKHYFPEANKYYDVYKRMANISDPALKEKIMDQHAKTVYQGLGLHTLLIFSAIMISQLMTKLRVKQALKG
jgi:hypothetical protein